MSLSLWEWLSGPSVALTAIMLQVVWTTAGTFMLMFLAGLQDLPTEVEEAAMVDGANRWQRFRNVTVPHLRPTILLVITLGIIGTWQVFDQMYVMTQGGPAKTTLTPAYLSYTAAFRQQQWGQGAAMAFLLFVLIFVLTTFQRFVLRDKDEASQRKAERAQRRAARQEGGDGMTQTAASDSIAPGAPGPRHRGRARPRRPRRRPSTTATSSTAAAGARSSLVYPALVDLRPASTSTRSSCRSRRRSRPTRDAVDNPLAIVPDPITTAAFERLADTPTSRCGSRTPSSSPCSSPWGGSSSTRSPATRWPG